MISVTAVAPKTVVARHIILGHHPRASCPECCDNTLCRSKDQGKLHLDLGCRTSAEGRFSGLTSPSACFPPAN